MPLRDQRSLSIYGPIPSRFQDLTSGWNARLRQRIPLVHARAVVVDAPTGGHPHEVIGLDTLGIDRRESGCTAFADRDTEKDRP